MKKNGVSYTIGSSLKRKDEDEMFCWSVRSNLTKTAAGHQHSGDTPETVGSLHGNLFLCTTGVHAVADAISGEAQELACMFCDSNGAMCRIQTGLPHDKFGGKLMFHIEHAVVSEGHDQDLVLHLIHQSLSFLEEWRECSTHQLQLKLQGAKTEEMKEFYRGLQMRMPSKRWEWNLAVVVPYEQQRRRFARMGFAQAGRNVDHHHAYYLTSAMYVARDGSDPESKWKSEEEGQSINLYTPPLRHEPSDIDKELEDLVKTTAQPDDASLRAVEAVIVSRGANIHNSRALFIAAGGKESRRMLQCLIRLGGDVNAADEDGNRPLHVAAAAKQASSIQTLLTAGARIVATNEKGQTALDSLKASSRSSSDFMSAFGFSTKSCSDVLNRFQCISALMPPNQKPLLIDGWLSPRVLYMLETTAGTEIDGLLDCGVNRAEYFPPDLQSSGRVNTIGAGWEVIWQAMHTILRRNQSPTAARIHQEVAHDPEYHQYVSKGGKVDYAVNALALITKNVAVDGDDGWEYEMFAEDIESKPATALDDDFDLARVKLLGLKETDTLPDGGPFRNGPFGGGDFADDDGGDY